MNLQQLFEYRHDKLRDMHKISQIVDDIAINNPRMEDAVLQLLGIESLDPDAIEQHLYKQDAETVHKILRKLSQLGK